MSEFVQHITLCDRCRPGEQGEGLAFHPFTTLVDSNTGKSSTVLLMYPGVFRGAFDLAAQFGWQERDYGQICPECVKAEGEEEAFSGDPDTVSGAVYDHQITGAGNEEQDEEAT